MGLRVSKEYIPSGNKVKVVEKYEVNFPMSFLYINGKSSSSSSKMKVNGLCGVGQEFSEFSLLSPTEYDYKFEKYEHIKPHITKSKFKSEYVCNY